MARSTQTLRVNITGNARQLQGTLDGVQGKLRSFGEGMQRVGKNLTKMVTVPIVGLAVGVTRMGMRFDESFSRIQGLVGVTGGALDELRKGVLRLAGQTARSPQELADALFYVTSAGFRGKEALGILEQAARAAAAGLGDTNDIAKLLTGALNAYPDLKADVALDQLAKAAEQGSFEVSELAAVLGNSLPVASALGIGFDSVTSSVASLTKLNNDAGASLTQVDAIMSAMLKPSKQAEKALAEVGLTMADLRQEAAEKGLPAALQTLHGALGDNEEAIGRVFGRKEAISGFFGLMREGGTDVAGILDEVRDSTGKMDEAFDAAASTGAHKMRQAMASLQGVGLQLWEVMSGPLSSVLESLTKHLKTLADWFANLSPKAQQAVLIFAGLAAALGPVLVVAGMLVKAVAALIPVFAAITATAALVVGGLAALGVALVLAYKHSETFRNVVNAVFGAVAAFVSGALSGMRKTFETTTTAIRVLWAAWGDEIRWFAQATFIAIRALIGAAMDAIRAIVSTSTAAIRAVWRVWGDDVLGFARSTWESIKRLIGGVLDVIRGVFNVFVGVFTADWRQAWGGIKQIVTGVWNMLRAGWEQFLNYVTTIGRVALDAFYALWGSTWERIRAFAAGKFNEIVAGVLEMRGRLLTFFRELPGQILERLKNLPGQLFQVGKDALRLLADGFKSFDLWGAIKGIFTGLLSKVKGFFGIGSPSKVFAQLGRDIAQGMAQGIKSDADQVNKAARHLADAAGVNFHSDVGGRGGGLAPTKGLNPEFLKRFMAWSNSVGGLRIVSGYRSTERQAQLYRDYLAGRGNLAAPPGRSMHEKGLAIDHAPRSWGLAATARPFGLHHPVSSEPWHVEPRAKGAFFPRATLLAENPSSRGEWVLPDEKLRAAMREESGTDALIDEVRGLRQDVGEVRAEIRRQSDRSQLMARTR